MKIPVLILVVLLSLSSFSQDQDKNKAWLLEKSKAKKKTAVICLAAGGGAIIAGALIPRGDLVEEGFWFVPNVYENSDIKTLLILAGSVSSITSLFLFGRSSKLERKAMQLSFKNEPSSALVKNGISSINIPSVSLKLRL